MLFTQCLDQQVSELLLCIRVANAHIITNSSLVGGNDYQEINAKSPNEFLIFDNNNRRQSFSVAITNNSFFEQDIKNFSLELRFAPSEIPLPSNVQLSQDVTTIEILDDDGMI